MPVRPNTGSAADGLRPQDAARTKRHTADFLESTGDAVGIGGELCLSADDAAKKPGLACTVESPDAVAAEASLDRLELTAEANCLAMAADAAEMVQARKSLEKMLAHQMAAAHAASSV